MPSPTRPRFETKSLKKGAFLALQAGVPPVPIVIRNAADEMAHDSPILHPGRVDVIVHAPIPVDGWTTHDLNNRITEIRQLYLDTLAHWPASLTTPAEDQQQRPPEPTTAGTA